MVLVILKLWISIDQRKKFLSSVRYLQDLISVYPGLIECSFFRNVENTTPFLIVEKWEGWGDLQRYLRSSSYKIMLNIMELSEEDPEINFYEIRETRSMEFIREARM